MNLQENLNSRPPRLTVGILTLNEEKRIASCIQSAHFADQILVMEEGRVVEQGRHDELLARGERYAMMWARQSDDDMSVDRYRIDETPDRDVRRIERDVVVPRAMNL